MKPNIRSLAPLAVMVLAAAVDAAPINQVPYASLTGTRSPLPDDVAGGRRQDQLDGIFCLVGRRSPSACRPDEYARR
jgi:hypothetical protein